MNLWAGGRFRGIFAACELCSWSNTIVACIRCMIASVKTWEKIHTMGFFVLELVLRLAPFDLTVPHRHFSSWLIAFQNVRTRYNWNFPKQIGGNINPLAPHKHKQCVSIELCTQISKPTPIITETLCPQTPWRCPSILDNAKLNLYFDASPAIATVSRGRFECLARGRVM